MLKFQTCYYCITHYIILWYFATCTSYAVIIFDYMLLILFDVGVELCIQ